MKPAISFVVAVGLRARGTFCWAHAPATPPHPIRSSGSFGTLPLSLLPFAFRDFRFLKLRKLVLFQIITDVRRIRVHEERNLARQNHGAGGNSNPPPPPTSR